MRNIPTVFQRLADKADRAVHLRVGVLAPGTDGVVLNTLEGGDWVLGAEWSEASDNAVATARITLRREAYALSLAPTVTSKLNRDPSGGPSPLLDVGRFVRIEVQLGPLNAPPDYEGTWAPVFDGYVDEIDWGGDGQTITLACRDQAAVLQDRYIEDEQPPPAPGTSWYTALTWPRAAETFLQELIDNTLGPGVVALETPTSPAWMLNKYAIAKEPLLEALRKVATSIGWDLRYVWNDGAQEFLLTLFEPGRTNTGYAVQWGPEFYRVDSAKKTLANVRNRVQVVWTNAVGKVREKTLAEDVDSQAAYGVRFCEIAEASSSNIDRSAEAQKLADAVLADLKTPRLEVSASVPLYPWLQLGDVVKLMGGHRFWTADTQFSLVGVRHAVGQGKAVSTLTLREEDSVGGIAYLKEKIWLYREARPGVAPYASFVRDIRAAQTRVYQTVSQTIIANSLADVSFDTRDYDLGRNFDTVGGLSYTVPVDGVYSVDALVTLVTVGTGVSAQAGIFVKSGVSPYIERKLASLTQPNTKGAGTDLAVAIASPALQLSAGDLLRIRVQHNDSVSRATRPGRNDTWLAVFRVR